MDLPLVGTIVQQFRLSQFARTLGTLLKGGIPLVSALETAGGAMESPVMRHAVTLSAERVREGRPLNAALADSIALFFGDARRRGFFDNFLMAALH